MSSVMAWYVASAFALSVTGLTRQATFEGLGVKVQSAHAYAVATLVVIGAQLSMLLLLLRLQSLLGLLDANHVLTGISALTTHAWSLNPFGYFGGGLLARLHSATSYGMFFFVMTFGFLPIVTQRLGSQISQRIATYSSLFIAFAIPVTIWSVLRLVVSRLASTDSVLSSAIQATIADRTLVFPPILFAVGRTARALSKWRAQA